MMMHDCASASWLFLEGGGEKRDAVCSGFIEDGAIGGWVVRCPSERTKSLFKQDPRLWERERVVEQDTKEDFPGFLRAFLDDLLDKKLTGLVEDAERITGVHLSQVHVVGPTKDRIRQSHLMSI